MLGPVLGPLFHALYDEVTWLHAKWKQYRILFAESPERIELLNGIAGFFFRVIQDVLWEDVVLHIARLTDPSRSFGKDNLTLLRLAGTVQEPALSLEVANLVETGDVRSKTTYYEGELFHRKIFLLKFVCNNFLTLRTLSCTVELEEV